MKTTPKKLALRLGVLALAFSAAGCGDSFGNIVRTEMALLNEFADNLARVVDESSAEDFQTSTFLTLKEAQEEVKKRKEKYLKAHFEDDQADFENIIAEACNTHKDPKDPESSLCLGLDRNSADHFDDGVSALRGIFQPELEKKQKELSDAISAKQKGLDKLQMQVSTLNSHVQKIDRAKKYLDEYRVEYTKDFRDEFLSVRKRIQLETDRIATLSKNPKTPWLNKVKDDYKAFSGNIGLNTSVGSATLTISPREGIDNVTGERVVIEYDVSVMAGGKAAVAFADAHIRWFNSADNKGDERDVTKESALTATIPKRDEPRRIRFEAEGWSKSRQVIVFARAPDPKPANPP